MRNQYDAYVRQINSMLEGFFPKTQLPGSTAAPRLTEAMSYSLLSGGKRIRPVLLLAFCEAAGGDVNDALRFACALEMVHTYSLIHDDLPCMDNDDFRRGRPTNHKVFGEAAALLAGDALLTMAYETMLNPLPKDPKAAISAVLALSQAAGHLGMIAGQQLELDGSNDLTLIHRLKTGCLFSTAAVIGCELAHAPEEQHKAAAAYADAVSLAFQIQDDILDGDGFVPVIGEDACKDKVALLTNQAKAALAAFDKPDFLMWLADTLAVRER